MPRLTKRERESKRNALKDAVESLKLESHPGNNLLTQENVCMLANESKDFATWSTPLSIQTLKNNDKNGLGYQARNTIIKFKDELEELKESSEDQLLEKLKNSVQKNDSLIMQIVKLLDNEMELKKEIDQLQLLLERKNDEIKLLMKKKDK